MNNEHRQCVILYIVNGNPTATRKNSLQIHKVERKKRERRNTIIAASHRIVRLCELEAPNIVWTVLGTKYDHSEMYKVCLEWNTFSTSHIQARTAFLIRLMLDSSESHTCVLQNKSWAANVFVCQTSVNNFYAHGQLSISLSLHLPFSHSFYFLFVQRSHVPRQSIGSSSIQYCSSST